MVGESRRRKLEGPIQIDHGGKADELRPSQ